MKLSLIGGAGLRTPLLLNGLAASDLPIDEVALYDVDRARLAVVADLARRKAPHLHVTVPDTVEACVEGAGYVFISIRVGGIEQRARDEAIALAHGVVGQETCGAAGFAMAMRTIPHALRYAAVVAERAPDAWIVNFTNPVGIVTQAISTTVTRRVVGICDTPGELFEDIAHALDVPSKACHFDYLGLNHLGWVREAYHRGVPQLGRLWNDRAALERLYRAPLFDGAFLQQLHLLPTEYLFYYYHPDRAVANTRAAARSRGAVIEQLNAGLFEELAGHPPDPVAAYERYLAARNASYMQIESGSPTPLARSPWAELTGYDRIALDVVSAIHGNTGAIIVLDVPNRGNLPGLDDDDVVEVPCVVTANGPLPLHVGQVPAAVADLVHGVKAYERTTIDAALSGDRERAWRALASNPLVPGRETARALLDQLLPA